MRAAFESIRKRVESGDAVDEAALKSELMGVFREVDQTLASLTALKEDIKQLVERWKARRASAPSLTPQFLGARPALHEDHLGASTFLEKGWTKISFGDYEGAESALQKALELAPTNTEGQSLLGWAQMLQDKLDAALMNFQYVLMRDPANSLARINVGFICLKKGIFGEAIEHLTKALRQDEDPKAKLYANFYLGLVYTEREMYEDAQIFFERTIASGPNLVEAYFELGHTLWRSGQPDRALEVWKSGAAANRFNPWGKRCTEMIGVAQAGGVPRRSSLSRTD